jgi:hypothetical protein
MIISWIKKNIARPIYNPQNILDSTVRMPETVYIVAGGPNGVAHYHRIPKNGYVIVTNKSVLIPGIHPSMWILNSMNKGIRRWIWKAHISFKGIFVLKHACLDSTPKYMRKNEHFIYVPNQGGNNEGNLPISANTLRSGGTVSGFAIQISAHLGARKIVLCGVDMSGQDYWDGRTGNNKNHGDIWSYAKTVDNTILDFKRKYNLSVSSLSPTKLNVPIC